jgi:hypothetical protein
MGLGLIISGVGEVICCDHLIALRNQIGYEVAPNEAVGTGYEHPGLTIHLFEYRRELP